MDDVDYNRVARVHAALRAFGVKNTKGVSMQYDPETALLVVDVQNDFCDPGGRLYVEGGEELIPLINREILAARRAGAIIVHSQDWHPEETPHFAQFGGEWPVHCVRDSWGAELHPGLSQPEHVIHKGMGDADGYSAFSVRELDSGEVTPTELARLLSSRSVDRVVVVGLAGDVCVQATAADARRLGYEVVVPLEMTRFVNGDDKNSAVTAMRSLGIEASVSPSWVNDR